MSWLSRAFLAVLAGLLVLPFAMALVVSLGSEAKIAFPPAGLSLRWYAELFVDAKWRGALVRSVLIALVAATLAISLALPVCYGLWRRPSRFARGLFGLSLAPFLLPPIILAIGAVAFWLVLNSMTLSLSAWLGWDPVRVYGRMATTILSHGVFLLPLASLIIARGFASLNPELIEASRTLGANARALFTSLLLPLLLPYILTGFVLVFIVSLNEYLIAFQVAGVSVETLPIRIFNDATRGGHSPILTAGAVLFATLTVGALLALSWRIDLLKLFGSQDR